MAPAVFAGSAGRPNRSVRGPGRSTAGACRAGSVGSASSDKRRPHRELADPAEAAALGALTLAAYRSLEGPPPPPEYEAELADVATRARAGPVLVALLDGRVVRGVAYGPVGGVLAEFAGPGEAQIRMLAVDPNCHGRGVGEALVRHCLDRARAEGCAAVSLFSTTRMTAAHRLYERLVRAPERDWEPHSGRLLWGFRRVLE